MDKSDIAKIVGAIRVVDIEKYAALETKYRALKAMAREAEEFHPRAMKLIRKKKNFIVIAEDEPYFAEAYNLIRRHEMSKGTWTEEDERIFHAALLQKGE